MEWFAILPGVLLLTLVMFAPGLVFGRTLHLRGPLLWGFAPAASVAMVGVAALGADLLGLRWGLLTAAGFVVGFLIVAFFIGRLIRPNAGEVMSRSRSWVGIFLLGSVGSIVGVVGMAATITAPDAISQSNDAVFHLNALQFIDETGSASSLHIAELVGARQFYPAAWHGAVSLATTAGVPITYAANAMSLVIAGPIWVTSIIAFVWILTRGDRTAAAAAAFLAPLMPAFPYFPLQWGVLYPNALSVAIFPAVAAIAVLVARWIVDGTLTLRRLVVGVLLTLVGLAGVALAQPAMIQIWFVVVALLAFQISFSLWREASWRRRLMIVAAALITLAFAGLGWRALKNSTSGVQWSPTSTRFDAVVDVLANSPVGLTPSIAISILAVVGLVVMAVRGPRWFVGLWATSGILYVVAASVHNEYVRQLLLGAWYGDIPRLAALLPLVAIPPASIAVSWLVAHRATLIPTAVAYGLVGVLVLGAFVEATLRPLAPLHNERPYAMTNETYLSFDELTLAQRLPDLVNRDARILVNPSTGAGFAYALSGMDTYPRTWARPTTPDFLYLADHLRYLDQDALVCEAVDRAGYDYVLDFGAGEQRPGRWLMPGLTDFDGKDGFELVARSGEASLWRITGCA